jgi:hypothetical protein
MNLDSLTSSSHSVMFHYIPRGPGHEYVGRTIRVWKQMEELHDAETVLLCSATCVSTLHCMEVENM